MFQQWVLCTLLLLIHTNDQSPGIIVTAGLSGMCKAQYIIKVWFSIANAKLLKSAFSASIKYVLLMGLWEHVQLKKLNTAVMNHWLLDERGANRSLT